MRWVGVVAAVQYLEIALVDGEQLLEFMFWTRDCRPDLLLQKSGGTLREQNVVGLSMHKNTSIDIPTPTPAFFRWKMIFRHFYMA